MVIIAAVLAFHLALLILMRPSFFGLFEAPNPTTAEMGKGDFIPSDSPELQVLTIPIEIEEPADPGPAGEAAEPPAPERRRRIAAESLEPVPAETASGAGALPDFENLPGGSPKPLPRSSGSGEVTIPPRAIEITWPDTRKLKHCLQHRVDIRIRVGDDGAIVAVEPLGGDHPPDCVRAALESAARIVFEPGRINGVPVAMWTQVRIEFRSKD
jgi:hypothetical protein